jgi:AcrR family transcriptional regulator
MAQGRERGSARPSGKGASNKGGARAGVADPDRIVDTAMALVAEQGWREVSLAAVAEVAGLTTLQVYRIFPSKAAILAGLFRRTDEAVLAGPLEAEDGERPRDRLFDLLMRRFDALQPYREGLGRLRRELPFDPPSALCAGAALLGSMRWMLDGAGIRTAGIGGIVAVKLTAAAYLAAAHTWTTDESPDLAPTMAALDRRLRGVERWLTAAHDGSNRREATQG